MTATVLSEPSPGGGLLRARLRLLARLLLAALACVWLWQALWFLVWRYHFDATSTRLERRDFEGALIHLAWCRWARPSDADTWLLAARTARRAGRSEESRAWLDVAREKGARTTAVQRERVLAFAQEQDLAQCEQLLLDQLRSSRSDYPIIAEVLTDEYMRTYQFSNARDILNRWIEIAPTDVEAHVRRAWVAEHQLDFGTALADYEKVLELEPGRAQVRLRVAELLLKIRRPTEALASLSLLPRTGAPDVNTAVLRARSLRELGRFDEAEAELIGLAEDDRRSPAVRAEQGKLALARGALREAESLLRGALRELPRERDLLYSLHQCLSRLGRHHEADELLRALKQADADARRMGELMSQIARNPTDAQSRYECALIFLRNGVTEDGVRWLRLALEANPSHKGAHEQLAAHYEKAGDAERARRHRQAARARD
jgi:tetratricopeptide (TPR) repeat protein